MWQEKFKHAMMASGLLVPSTSDNVLLTPANNLLAQVSKYRTTQPAIF